MSYCVYCVLSLLFCILVCVIMRPHNGYLYLVFFLNSPVIMVENTVVGKNDRKNNKKQNIYTLYNVKQHPYLSSYLSMVHWYSLLK